MMSARNSSGDVAMPFAVSFLVTSVALCAVLMIGISNRGEPPMPVVEALDFITERLCSIEKAVTESTASMESSAKVVARAIVLSNAMPPLLYRDAELGDDAELSRESNGIRLGSSHRERLERMVHTVASNCRISEDASNLVLKVVGYSSEAPFRGAENSDCLNVQAANLRALVVVEALRLMFDATSLKDRVTVQPHRWAWYDEIERPRLGDAAAVERRDSWLIERSVFVRIENPSVCWP